MANTAAMADSEKHEKPDNVPSPISTKDKIVLDHSENPMNMSQRRKWTITMLTCSTTFTATFGSSVFSSGVGVMSRQFDVSEVVMLLGLSLYVAGFAVGPLFWGPLSERYGRKTPLFSGLLLFAIFQIPVAVARNLPTIFICRFLQGTFAGAPIVVNSAMFADFWAPVDRGKATSIYSLTCFVGPGIGPIVGSFCVENSNLGWRWTAWFTLILAAAAGIPAFIFVPETYEPILLSRKAERLGLPAGAPGSFTNFVRKYLTKPVLMMVMEPMLIVMTVYICFIYGLLYLTFFAFPYSFEHDRHWSPQISSLPFLAILIGVCFSAPAVFIYSTHYYMPRLIARGKVLPEDRLPPMMVGSVLLPIGLFWFGWSSNPNISWVPQVLSGAFVGAGIMLIFSCGIAYIVDVYLTSAASALAANTFVRSIVAAGFPLFAPAMYRSLGTAWATSVLGFIAITLIPAPIVFYIYGPKIRAKSRFTPKK